MKTILILVISAIVFNTTVFSQCDFFDDYSTNTGWTQVGTEVKIQNGTLNYINGSDDGLQRRVYKSLGFTLNSGDNWRAEFEFTPQSVGTYLSQPFTGHGVLALTAGNQEPYLDCPDLPCTGYPIGTQDGIMIMYATDGSPTGDIWFKARARHAGVEYQSTNQINANVLNTTYYPRLERTSASSVVLSVFSDSLHTIHLPGSPISLAIPESVTGLTTVQQGNAVRGNVQRELTGYIDNLCINYSLVSDENIVINDKTFNIYPNPNKGKFEIEISDNEKNVIVEIYNMLGKKVYSQDFSGNKLSLDFSAKPKGVYLVEVLYEDNVITKKVIVR